jgi:hypothetical protein
MPFMHEGWALGCRLLVDKGSTHDPKPPICALALYRHGFISCTIYRQPDSNREICVMTEEGTALKMRSVLTVVLPCMHYLDDLLVLVDAANRSGRKLRFDARGAWLAEEGA